MNGHGDYTYLSIVHSDNYDMLKYHTFALIDDYIANAPAGSNKALDIKWQRMSRKETPTLDNDAATGTIPNYFQSFINKTDPRYLERPLSFQGQIGTLIPPTNSTPFYLVSYFNSTLIEAGDVRVSYYNPKYPWIEAVHKYKHANLQAKRPDTASFQIPGRGGLGRYIVHYMWRGYRDCVDVDLKDTHVDDIYGIPPSAPSWTRIDHCLFENVREIAPFSVIVTDPQFCLDECTGSKCWG
jgi:hypothetical protein